MAQLLAPLSLLYAAVLLLTCAFALWRGGGPERIGAGAMLAASIVTPLVFSPDNFRNPEYGVLGVDISLLLLLVFLALRTDRFWPMWAAAFHVVGVAIHFGRIIDPTVWARAYSYANAFWAYPVLIALAVGTWKEAMPRSRALKAPP